MNIENQSMGSGEFNWWVGVVEDRMDPKKLGRLRVRVLGVHTEDKTLIPTEDLFWFYPYKPITSAAMNGIGTSPNGAVEGDWVFGFWLDAGKQDGVVMGTMGGIPQEAATSNLGFSDPGDPAHPLNSSPKKIASRYYPNDGSGAQLQEESAAKTYPRTSNPWGCVVGEPDVNRLARAEKVDDTIIGVRNRQRDVQVPIGLTALSKRQWNEPTSTYNAQYPYNHVIETESGHVLELDDTPGAERIHIFHRSGTYLEIQGGKDGDFLLKCVGKRYEVTMENSYAHFQNTMNVTVDGETNIYCRSNANLQVDGNLTAHVGGDYTEKVNGNYYTDIKGNRVVRVGGTEELDVQGARTTRVGGTDSLDVDGDHSVIVGGNDTASASGSRTITTGGSETHGVQGAYTMSSGGSAKHSSGSSFTIAAGGSITESAGGSFSAKAGGSASMDGSGVYLNSGKSSSASPSSPGSPSNPASPTAPELPTLPNPLNQWTENANESGSQPQQETKGS